MTYSHSESDFEKLLIKKKNRKVIKKRRDRRVKKKRGSQRERKERRSQSIGEEPKVSRQPHLGGPGVQDVGGCPRSETKVPIQP